MIAPDRQSAAGAATGLKARRGILLPGDIRRLIAFAFTLFVIVPGIAWMAGGFDDWSRVSWRPGLDLSVFASAPLSTRIHAIIILVLVVAGWIMLALPKGDRRHRTLGWIWVSGMVAMGATSLTVPHGDSWVAAYIGGGSALALLAYGIYAVKTRRLRNHGRTMAMLMIALVLMTLLSLMPGRLLHDVVFGG
jgi:uncharacterized membrane protein